MGNKQDIANEIFEFNIVNIGKIEAKSLALEIADYVLKREAIAELRGIKKAAEDISISKWRYSDDICPKIISYCDAKLAELEKKE